MCVTRIASQQEFFRPKGLTYWATANVVLSEAEDVGRVQAGSLSRTGATFVTLERFEDSSQRPAAPKYKSLKARRWV